jgi:polyisoprenoid-binding protein YceI
MMLRIGAWTNRLVALVLAASLQICLASSPPASQEPQRQAVSYVVDTDASRIYVKVGTSTRLGHEHGVEGNLKSGKITLGGEGELVFDMASFSADSLASRKRVGLERKKVSENEAKKVTAAMRGGDVLDVVQYPTATYQISSIRPIDKQAAGEPGTYQLEGRFKLHGVEQKLALKAKLERADKDGRLRMTGRFAIKQTDYGMTPVSAAAGLAKVADKLEITGELVLRTATSK